MKRTEILLCFAMLLTAGAARGQQPASQQGSGDGEQTRGESAEKKSTPQETRRESGIVADNLERVAATAEQILDVVNRDAGMMVELKRAIAEDAGESGQILEESDLSENAITERLHQDLRTRVLATRLLRKYGYLLPKLNPDSELAAEHNLEMRARAQQLERASESHDSNRAVPQTVITVGAPPSAERPRGLPARGPVVEVGGALDSSRPEMLAAPPEAHADLVKTGGRPSEQTAPAERASYRMPAERIVPARRSRLSCFLKMDSEAALSQVSTGCPTRIQGETGSPLSSPQNRAKKSITPRGFEGGLQPPRGRNTLFPFAGLPYGHHLLVSVPCLPGSF